MQSHPSFHGLHEANRRLGLHSGLDSLLASHDYEQGRLAIEQPTQRTNERLGKALLHRLVTCSSSSSCAVYVTQLTLRPTNAVLLCTCCSLTSFHAPVCGIA